MVDPHYVGINAVGAESSGLIRFFFQYRTGVPFGLSIVFFPFLIVGLYRLARNQSLLIAATVLVPLLVVTVYWGSCSSGLLREGLHAWVLTLLMLWSIETYPQLAGAGPGARLIRAVLLLPPVEVGLMLFATTLSAVRVQSPGFAVADLTAILKMVGGLVGIGWLTLAVSRPSGLLGESATRVARDGN